MRTIISPAVVCLLLFSTGSVRAEVVISDDGRQIELKADGTWQQLSRDRFATNAAGQRVRLHPDGTWSVDGQADLEGAADGVAPALQGRVDAVMHLSDVTILRRVIERAKSKHSESRVHFVMQVDNRTGSDLAVPADLMSRLRATSNRGAQYELISAKARQSVIPAGERVAIDVWAEWSSFAFRLKHLSIEVAPGTFGNSVTRVLSRNMTDIERREVDSF